MKIRPSLAGFSALVRLSLGAALIIHEGMIREQAQYDVLIAGLGLLVLPDAVKFDRWMVRLRAFAEAEAAEDQESTP